MVTRSARHKPLGRDKVNIFFGDPVCIEVVTRICRKPLNHLSPEEDFILGTMLGYSLLLQCRRYLQRADRRRETPTKATAFSQTTHSRRNQNPGLGLSPFPRLLAAFRRRP